MTRITVTELERRWSLLRTRMEEKSIDAYVAMNSDREHHGGYSRWLTGEQFGYTVAIVFHKSDLMTRVEHGSEGDIRAFTGDEPGYRGVGVVKRTAEFCAVSYSHLRLISHVVDDVARRGYKRIGLLGMDRMSYGMVEAIKSACAGVEIINETEFIDNIVAIKGPEEIALLRENISIQASSFRTLLAELRPGMREIDAENLVRSDIYSRGGTGGVCTLGSSPMGTPAFFQSRDPQRRIEKGDQVTILIETTGPDGYFTEMGRTIVLGKATNELRESAEIATEAIDNVLAALRRGETFPAVAATHDAFMRGRRLPPERRILAHSSGYDVVQRPLIREDETLAPAENMFFAIHPTFVTDGVFGWMVENFLLEAGGPTRPLHDVPQQIFEV